eukprot:11520136-Ditylum_brightwellii.AAC.1
MPCTLPPRIPSDPTGSKICNAVETQHELGWNNFMKGRIAKQWCKAQALYCRSLPKPKMSGMQGMFTYTLTWRIKQQTY